MKMRWKMTQMKYNLHRSSFIIYVLKKEVFTDNFLNGLFTENKVLVQLSKVILPSQKRIIHEWNSTFKILKNSSVEHRRRLSVISPLLFFFLCRRKWGKWGRAGSEKVRKMKESFRVNTEWPSTLLFLKLFLLLFLLLFLYMFDSFTYVCFLRSPL